MKKWIDILTENKPEKIAEFGEIKKDSASLPLAIMKYRRLQMADGRGQDIRVINDTASAQEVFLEPIVPHEIQLLHKKCKELKIDLCEGYARVLNMHKKDNNKRFLSLVISL